MSDQDSGAVRAANPDVAGLMSGGNAAGHWVLDPAGSSVEFAVRHFWGAITVRGSFGTITGEGTVGEAGTATGWLNLDATSLSTRNKQRDQHLRSADFFDVEHHPRVVVTVTAARPAGPDALACQGTLEAAGHTEPIEFTARVEIASENAIVLHAEIEVDRTKFAMTWSPLRVAAFPARGTAVARFVRS
ncbi:MAG TPA: YceI family protein [Streptosporangiaceae bacterium]|nr:YceI family protein [Streptosporangiaceae bacterium]